MGNYTMSRFSLMVKTYVAMALALVVMGCSTSNSQAPQFNTALAKHPDTWAATHWVNYNQNKAQCTPCHGSATDPTSTGGQSGINCFSCHAQQTPVVFAPQHPAGWANVGNTPFHGATAKQAASLTGGFAHCAACHGTVYNNADGTTVSCMACHTKAPHPDAPWDGTTASGTIHSNTDPSNATECAKCHTAGANSTIPFLTPAPAGTAPGCFNNTLCHGNIQGHNATWAQPAQHGLLGAMAAPDPANAKGFLACQVCHGADYASGPYTPCFSCHQQGAPHPTGIPAITATINHGLTDQGNAAVCFTCHASGKNFRQPVVGTPAPNAQPGCNNSTMCHGVIPPTTPSQILW
jgi:hypothetical protein